MGGAKTFVKCRVNACRKVMNGVEVGWGLCVPMNVWHVHSSPYGKMCGPMDYCKARFRCVDPDVTSQSQKK